MGKGYRQGRLGEEIRRIISELLISGIKDPRVAEHMISISGVSVTSDGSYATCYVSVLNFSKDEEEKKTEENDILAGLNSAKGNIQTSEGTPYTGVDLQDGSLHGLRQTHRGDFRHHRF